MTTETVARTGTILDKILDTKRAEVAALYAGSGIDAFKAESLDLPPTRGFRQALVRPATALIAEVKKASPSKGLIRANFAPAAIARAYEAGGASCLSVLTDEVYFQGSLSFLKIVRESVALPLLRKDFIIDPIQIYEARVAGADAILLIVAAIPSAARLSELRLLSEFLGLDVLVEVHNRAELDLAIASQATLIGVNNRNLHTFEVRLETTEELLPLFPANAVSVSESGIFTSDDVRRVRHAGANAILVGESLMRSEDIEQATKSLLQE